MSQVKFGQVKFGKRYAVAQPGDGKRAGATVAAADEPLRLALLIVTGVVTGFVIAAIECL
jgi:hypothetical protein